MRILVVTQYFWPENFKINDFVTGMLELGHSVTVLTGKPNYPNGKFFSGYGFLNRRTEFLEKAKIIRVPLIPRGNGTGIRLMINYFSFAFAATVASYFRIKDKPDIIFVYEPSPITVGIPAIFLKKRTKTAMIFWVLDLWPDSVEIAGNVKNKIILKIIDRLVRMIYINSDKIFVSCRSFRDAIIKKNVDPGKIVYYPNWPEEVYVTGVSDIYKYRNLIPEGFKIMFAGNIGDSQDFDAILAAASLLKDNKDIQWIILGDGRRKAWVEAEIARLNLKACFHLLGSFPLKEMPDFFYHCDAMLVTLRESEIFSMTVPAKIQSYLAFGKPILAMLNGEGSSIIEESKAGVCCNAGDYKQLGCNINYLYNLSSEQRNLMGENAKRYCHENFNRKALFKKFEQIGSDLLSGNDSCI